MNQLETYFTLDRRAWFSLWRPIDEGWSEPARSNCINFTYRMMS